MLTNKSPSLSRLIFPSSIESMFLSAILESKISLKLQGYVLTEFKIGTQSLICNSFLQKTAFFRPPFSMKESKNFISMSYPSSPKDQKTTLSIFRNIKGADYEDLFVLTGHGLMDSSRYFVTPVKNKKAVQHDSLGLLLFGPGNTDVKISDLCNHLETLGLVVSENLDKTKSPDFIWVTSVVLKKEDGTETVECRVTMLEIGFKSLNLEDAARTKYSKYYNEKIELERNPNIKVELVVLLVNDYGCCTNIAEAESINYIVGLLPSAVLKSRSIQNSCSQIDPSIYSLPGQAPPTAVDDLIDQVNKSTINEPLLPVIPSEDLKLGTATGIIFKDCPANINEKLKWASGCVKSWKCSPEEVEKKVAAKEEPRFELKPNIYTCPEVERYAAEKISDPVIKQAVEDELYKMIEQSMRGESYVQITNEDRLIALEEEVKKLKANMPETTYTYSSIVKVPLPFTSRKIYPGFESSKLEYRPSLFPTDQDAFLKQIAEFTQIAHHPEEPDLEESTTPPRPQKMSEKRRAEGFYGSISVELPLDLKVKAAQKGWSKTISEKLPQGYVDAGRGRKFFDFSSEALIKKVEDDIQKFSLWFFSQSNSNLWYSHMAGVDMVAKVQNLRLLSKGLVETKISTVGMETLLILSYIAKECSLSSTFSLPSSLKTLQLKNILGLPIWILMKPSGPAKGVGVSMLYDPRFISLGEWGIGNQITTSTICMTDFFTMNELKISHFISMHLNTLNVWTHLSDCMNVMNETSDFKTTLSSFILLQLECKRGSFRQLGLLKYEVQQSTAGVDATPNAVIPKLDPKARSALWAWSVNVVIKYARHILKNPVVRVSQQDDEELTKFSERFDNVHNPITLERLNDIHSAFDIAMVYFLEEISESDNHYAQLQILSKILEQEKKLEGTGSDMRFNDDLTRLNHSYSTAAVCLGANLLSESVYKTYGDKASLNSAIMRALVSTTLDELATLKSTKEMGMHPIKYHSGDGMKILGQTTKCLISVVKMCGKYKDCDSASVFQHLKDLQQKSELWLEVRGNTVVLFKKQQAGATREILILDFSSRLRCKFIEDISRVISKGVPEEMLTKADQKKGEWQKFLSEVFNTANLESQSTSQKKSTITRTTSIDFSTWCQMFIMPAFSQMFAEFLDPSLHDLVSYFLNYHVDKRICMQKPVLDFLSKSTCQVYDENIRELRSQFRGESTSNSLCNQGSTYVKNQTNMGQGILHNTSSIFGCCMFYLFRKFHNRFIRHTLPADLERSVAKYRSVDYIHSANFLSSNTTCILRFMESSDDAAVMSYYSIPESLPESMKKHAFSVFRRLDRSIMTLAPLFCMKVSEPKSTFSNLNLVMEFNSAYYFRATNNLSSMKFVCNLCTPRPLTTLIEANRMPLKLIQDAYEHGVSGSTCEVLEITCLMAHMERFGLLISPWFFEFWNLVVEKPHPSLGFFCLSPEYTAGVLGFDLAFYHLLTNSSLARGIEESLGNVLSWTEALDGRPELGIYLNSTRRRKLDKILERICEEEKVQNYDMLMNQLEARLLLSHHGDEKAAYKCMIKKPETILEVKYKMYCHLLSQNAAAQIGYSRPSTEYPMAAYVLTKPIIRVTDRSTFGETKVAKFVTLLGLLRDFQVTQRDLSPDKLALRFQNVNLLRETTELSKEIGEQVETFESRTIRPKLKPKKLSIKSPGKTLCDLLDTCKYYLFNERPYGVSMNMLKLSRERWEAVFQKKIDFDSMFNTMKNLNLEHPFQLFNLLHSFSEKNSRILIFLPHSTKNYSPIAILRLAIMSRYHSFMKMILKKEKKSNGQVLKEELWKSDVYPIPTPIRKKEILRALLNDPTSSYGSKTVISQDTIFQVIDDIVNRSTILDSILSFVKWSEGIDIRKETHRTILSTVASEMCLSLKGHIIYSKSLEGYSSSWRNAERYKIAYFSPELKVAIKYTRKGGVLVKHLIATEIRALELLFQDDMMSREFLSESENLQWAQAQNGLSGIRVFPQDKNQRVVTSYFFPSIDDLSHLELPQLRPFTYFDRQGTLSLGVIPWEATLGEDLWDIGNLWIVAPLSRISYNLGPMSPDQEDLVGGEDFLDSKPIFEPWIMSQIKCKIPRPSHESLHALDFSIGMPRDNRSINCFSPQLLSSLKIVPDKAGMTLLSSQEWPSLTNRAASSITDFLWMHACFSWEIPAQACRSMADFLIMFLWQLNKDLSKFQHGNYAIDLTRNLLIEKINFMGLGAILKWDLLGDEGFIQCKFDGESESANVSSIIYDARRYILGHWFSNYNDDHELKDRLSVVRECIWGSFYLLRILLSSIGSVSKLMAIRSYTSDPGFVEDFGFGSAVVPSRKMILVTENISEIWRQPLTPWNKTLITMKTSKKSYDDDAFIWEAVMETELRSSVPPDPSLLDIDVDVFNSFFDLSDVSTVESETDLIFLNNLIDLARDKPDKKYELAMVEKSEENADAASSNSPPAVGSIDIGPEINRRSSWLDFSSLTIFPNCSVLGEGVRRLLVRHPTRSQGDLDAQSECRKLGLKFIRDLYYTKK